MSAAAARRVAILAVGDELVAGQQLDTNSAWLAQALAPLGFEVASVTLLGDEREALVARLGDLVAEHALVVLTGGLGPTLDDLTRFAVADCCGVELERDEAVVAGIRERFAQAGRDCPEANARQALLPRGGSWLENELGTAPGFRLRHPGGAWIVCLPGPPRELQGIFEERLAPWLVGAFPGARPASLAQFFLYGLPESEFAERVGDWMARDADPRIGVCASGRVLKVRFEGRGERVAFEQRVVEFRARFGQAIYSEEHPTTAEALAHELLVRGVTCACAESCTGGEIASRLVAVPGISAVFLEGLVTYSNEAKVRRLGVEPELLERFGAVSPEVAAAMAAGAAARSGARRGISTTGVAGPEGGTPEKPVGLVHVGVSLDGEVRTAELRLPPRGRALIRDWAATSACALALRALAARA